MPFPHGADYTKPSDREIAALEKPRYGPMRGINWRRRQRTWSPSKERIAACRRIVYGRDNFTCVLCGFRPGDDVILPTPSTYAGGRVEGITLDHVIAYVKGGLFYPGNLQTLCIPCNLKKGSS